jgi:hypothetical protein
MDELRTESERAAINAYSSRLISCVIAMKVVRDGFGGVANYAGSTARAEE